jgi:RNA polymerase sigma-70 factor (ECF subfamily)
MNRQSDEKRGIHVHTGQDPQTFEEIYEAYGERILNTAFRFTRDEDTARDLTQDIFLKVYQNLESFEQRSHIFTWVYRVAINHISSHLNRERRHRWLNLLDATVTDVLHEDKLDPAYRDRLFNLPADKKLERSERERIVRETIQTLPVKYRVPLVLHHYEDMSYKEISSALDLSTSAVESRIHRAKKQLIKQLKPFLDKI